MSQNVVAHLPVTDATALVAPDGERLSFRQLKTQVEALAGGLRNRGIEPGNRVVLLIPMSIDLYVTLLAVFHVGATATLVDPAADIQGLLCRYPPDAFIGVPKAHLLRLKVPALRGLQFYGSTGFIPLPHCRIDRLTGPIKPVEPGTAPALLTFTTGTTGQPKAIGRSHAFLLGQHRVLHQHMSFGEGDVDLPTLPVFLLHSLASGATCVIADADLKHVGQVNPEPIVQQMTRESVTSTSGSPAFFRTLVDHLINTDSTLPTLRHIYTGGARVPATLVDDLARVLPNVSLHVVYGSTEAEPIAVLDAIKHRDELLNSGAQGALVGSPVADIAIRIDGEPFGEILVAGPHVNPGYVNDPNADAQYKVKDGDTIWHRTGDVGKLDAHGNLWLVGRVGESVAGLWPLAVEGAAEAYPWVRRSGLVAIDEQPVLAVELQDAPSDWKDQLQTATGVTPTALDSIPVDPRHNAKVDRRILVSLLRG